MNSERERAGQEPMRKIPWQQHISIGPAERPKKKKKKEKPSASPHCRGPTRGSSECRPDLFGTRATLEAECYDRGVERRVGNFASSHVPTAARHPPPAARKYHRTSAPGSRKICGTFDIRRRQTARKRIRAAAVRMTPKPARPNVSRITHAIAAVSKSVPRLCRAVSVCPVRMDAVRRRRHRRSPSFQ